MSQVAQEGVEPIVMDPYEIGWYIESADEEIYGPVSRKTLRRFLEEKTITPNTLVRHCTQPEARPAADQPGSWSSSAWSDKGSALGDRLAEAWPRKKRDRQALAEDSLPCAWHKRPAVLVCVRCHAPYCNSCRAKPFRKQFFLCRRCQVGHLQPSIRAHCLWIPSFLSMFPVIVAIVVLLALGRGRDSMATDLTSFSWSASALLLRARLALRRRRDRQANDGFAGRAVEGRDDAAHLRPGRRALAEPVHSHFQPGRCRRSRIRDPLLRRYGDRWAGTRVIDTERKLAKDRAEDRAAVDQEGSSACCGVGDDDGGACSACLTTDARKLSTPCAGRGSSPLVSRMRFTSSAATS